MDINGKYNIVLLSEWDSTYGRYLPKSICREIGQKPGANILSGFGSILIPTAGWAKIKSAGLDKK